MTTRRNFIALCLASGFAPRAGWSSVGSPTYLAAARDPDGGHALYGLNSAGEVTFRVALPERGHAGAGHPARAEAVVFARRPGRFALVLDCARGSVLHSLDPPKSRHFNGHGTFDSEGTLLFTMEQIGETSEGIIGIWDVSAGYRRVGEMRTHGKGPHDLRLMPDGATLVVANGGIATDPSTRDKLNIAGMRPSLTYLGLDGRIREQVELESGLHQNSIRHLAISPDGRVAFAMQWQGEPGLPAPLLGLHRSGAAPILAEAPPADEIAMRGYAGSVAFNGAGDEVSITSPRGGRIHRFSISGEFLGAVSRADVCGLAPHRKGYLASDGLGGLIAVGKTGLSALARHPFAWDNHIINLKLPAN